MSWYCWAGLALVVAYSIGGALLVIIGIQEMIESRRNNYARQMRDMQKRIKYLEGLQVNKYGRVAP